MGQIYISRRYDGYNHLKNEYKNNNGAVTDEYYSYKTSYPDSLEYVYDDKQRIDYTYHTIDGDLTNIPKTITYSYKNGRSWKIDYIITTTLTSDKKSIEYQTVTKAGETKAKTKYSYNESGEVTEIKYWTGDTNSDGLFDEADETITINNSYTVTGNDALRICQSIGGIIDADGNSISDIAEIYEYDIYGNPTVQTDAKNYKTEIVYDGIGRPVLYKYPNGAQQDIEYNNELNYAVVTDVSGKKFKYSYDSFGNLLSESFNEDNEWKVTGEYTYDDANRLVMSKNYTEPQMYIKKTYEYDIFDRLTKETVYDNSDNVQYIVNYTYTSWGSLVKTKAETDSQDGAEVADISEYYDAYGRKVKTEKGTGSGAIVTETEYDYQDRVISEKDANENVTQYTYDYAGNLLNVKNAANQEISYTYDALNRQLSATDANGNTTNYYYDNLGRNIKIEMPFSGSEKAVTKNYYDANSNLIQSKTQNNELTDEESFRTINYSYDNMNRLTQVYGDTDYVSYSYDIAGRITQMFAGNNENLQSTYSYDNRGFLASETDALGLSKYYTYDYAGNVKTMTDKNGAVHTNTYGIFGLTSQISQKGSLQQSLNYEYDSLGRIKTKTLNDADNTDISSYTYDVFGRILTNTSNAAVNSYTYDKNSNITAYELKENNIVKNSVTYEYNSINQLTKEIIGDTIMTYSYDNNGNITGKTIGGIATQIGYNKANLPVSMVTEGFGNEEYGYSLDGNRISEKDTVNNINKQYQYDAKGRLVGEVHSGAESFAKTYTYDAFGNRKSETQTGLGTTNYSYDRNNRLLKEEFLNSAGELNKEVNYYYDRNGNQMKKQELLFTDEGQDGISISGVSGSTVSEYSYNLNNQLTGYRSGDVEAYYSYTAEGLRKAKTVNGVTTEFIWDGGNLAAERKSGEITALYNYGADGIVMSNRDGAAEYYIKNIHGDVVGMTDAEGNLTDNYYYDAFGNEQSNTENTNPFRYCGEYYDEESGLIYLRNRYYNSSTGRFITEDPYWNIDNMMYGDEEESPVKDIVFINKEIYKINNENIVLNHLQGEKAENGQGFNAFIKAEEKAYSNENESQEKNNSIQLFAIEQSSNLYVYCINNPIRFIDPSGYNAIVTIHVVRDGNSRTCEVILSWSGNEMYSSWRFNSVSVVAYSKTYGTIRNTTVYPGAATSGSVSLGYVIIPQNIKRIKVKVNGLLGYNMQKGWQSVYMIPINANIK